MYYRSGINKKINYYYLLLPLLLLLLLSMIIIISGSDVEPHSHGTNTGAGVKNIGHHSRQRNRFSYFSGCAWLYNGEM